MKKLLLALIAVSAMATTAIAGSVQIYNGAAATIEYEIYSVKIREDGTVSGDWKDRTTIDKFDLAAGQSITFGFPNNDTAIRVSSYNVNGFFGNYKQYVAVPNDGGHYSVWSNGTNENHNLWIEAK